MFNLFGIRKRNQPDHCQHCGAGLSRLHLLTCSPITKDRIKATISCKDCGRIATLTGTDTHTRAALMVLLNQSRRSSEVM